MYVNVSTCVDTPYVFTYLHTSLDSSYSYSPTYIYPRTIPLQCLPIPSHFFTHQSKQCDALTKELAKLKESKVAVQRQHRIQAQEMLKLKKDQQIMLTTMKVCVLSFLLIYVPYHHLSDTFSSQLLTQFLTCLLTHLPNYLHRALNLSSTHLPLPPTFPLTHPPIRPHTVSSTHSPTHPHTFSSTHSPTHPPTLHLEEIRSQETAADEHVEERVGQAGPCARPQRCVVVILLTYPLSYPRSNYISVLRTYPLSTYFTAYISSFIYF